MQADEVTRGEMLISGLESIRSGLEMIRRAGGNRVDLVNLLATNRSGAQQLRELFRGPSLLHQVVLGMVSARNARLNADTVEKVVADFLAVLQDLAQPVDPPGGGGPDAQAQP